MSKAEVEPSEAPENGQVSVTHYLRYGWSTIRQEGLGYFIKRSYQLLMEQIRRRSHLIKFNSASQQNERMLRIDDIEITDLYPSMEGAEGITEIVDPQKQTTDRGRQPDDPHSRLVQLGMASHRLHLDERQSFIEQGSQLFAGKKVLFVSPIRVLGGGANLIILAAGAMRRMGVDAQILNLNVHRSWFEQHYPNLDIPVRFAEVEAIPQVAINFEAVIATSNPTVAWIAPAMDKKPALKAGYYIQDYEPYFYAESSHEYQRAVRSYTLIPEMVRMVTTPWIAEQIMRQQQVESTVIGAHVDTDLFVPRPRCEPSWPERAVRITAMIRPSTPRRNPKLTMSILQQASRSYPSKLETRLFGFDLTEPGFSSLPRDFAWRWTGELRSTQVAKLFNEADIFVDFSEFQALGLTALEAMASGMAVIVPKTGGTGVYALDGENCLVVDTSDQQACLTALRRLVEDDSLRTKLQENAVTTAAGFFTERHAFNMLKAVLQG
jgi:glycosyltransferase involved in cell wall biosynthesis